MYKYFRKWQHKGIWQALHDDLRKDLREGMNRDPSFSVAIADSQSVKTTEKGRLSKDYEVYTERSEAMIYGTLIRLMLKRAAA